MFILFVNKWTSQYENKYSIQYSGFSDELERNEALLFEFFKILLVWY